MNSRRRSYDQFREEDDDGSGATYACICGQEYMNQETLKRHQETNCQKRSTSCSFCQQTFPSLTELRDHLHLCGNKTDQCPNCRKFIRRSHFAYHYENNCAPIDEVETPPPRPKNRSVLHPPANSNKPISREDIPNDDYLGQHSSMHPQRVNGRIQSPISTPQSSPGIIECEFCHNQCAKNDYKTHWENCIRNPTNINYKPQQQQSRAPLGSNQNRNNSNDITDVPCEICDQPVAIADWSTHMKKCREREKQRIEQRARSMSQEPIIEQLPCEYCEKLFPAKQLQTHERNCTQNQENVVLAARRAREQNPKTRSLPIRSRPGGIRPTQSNDRFRREDVRNVHYASIDVDRTHEANRSSNNDRPINQRNANQNPIRRSPNDDNVIQSENYLRRSHSYDDEFSGSNVRRSNENLLRQDRPRPPNVIRQRERSSLDNLQNIEDTQNPIGRASDNRSPYHNDRKGQNRARAGRPTLEVINNQPGRAYVKKHKKSWWKSFCGLGGNTGAMDD